VVELLCFRVSIPLWLVALELSIVLNTLIIVYTCVKSFNYESDSEAIAFFVLCAAIPFGPLLWVILVVSYILTRKDSND